MQKMRFPFIYIILTIILAACTPSNSVRTPLELTSTITSSSTHTPETTATRIVQNMTSSSTVLAKSSPTPKPNNTRTPVPTFTPATPCLTPNESCTLQEWTPTQADFLVDQIAGYLSSIENNPEYAGVYGYSNYLEQYKYLAFIESEALLRFPDAQQAESWKWDLCYNLALSYQYAESTEAPELPCYSKLIASGLNTGKTDITHISDWFRANESRVSFKINSTDPPPGFTSSHLILLDNNAVLLLLEKNGVFQAAGLMSSMFFFRESQLNYQLIDLTGDNFPELVLDFDRAYCCGSASVQFIYNLSLGSPVQLSFLNLGGISSSVGSEYDSSITSLKDDGKAGLLFKSNYGNPLDEPCNLKKYDKYFWNGSQFELVDTWFGIDPPDEYDEKELCQFAINLATNPTELLVIVQSIQQNHPSETSAYREIIYFYLGEYYAQIGDWEKANEYFSLVVAEPGDNTSEWKKSAQQFLDNNKSGYSFYLLCSKISQCNIQNALRQFIETTKPESFPLIIEKLNEIGVPIKNTGIYDFDGDGIFEQWLVVQHPGNQEKEFWILVRGNTKIYALSIAGITENKPEIINFINRGKNTFELSQNGRTIYSLEKLGISGQPYILVAEQPSNTGDSNEPPYYSQTIWAQAIEDIASKVLTGSDLAQENKILLSLENSKVYGCENYACDELYYLLGLTNELLGEKQAAVDAYLQLWKNYPDSPYSIMVRSKLIALP